ncbi:MAG TPA: NAD-dependent DNA ligase LigA [Candidatus Pacearchaeota archaeon]|nr:NAD-dependent DNA ligase LigA [Candidatus Pacearchaeota archaeon]HOK94184.1 NAD-dependent DNA ligase LigA [Candidatus Pacearchaeota archaeon]HPO75176.1 NAD-dependent DNA ligase LigA [Candidatus Pacearchaeota archaeon]
MTKEEAKERIEKLKKEINYHRYLYHVLDRQEISDAALDSLKHELYELEQQYPELITPDSPTQRIGGKPLDKFKKVHHIVPQWSFNDIFSEEELKDFDERIKKELETKEVDYNCELKIDGMHIILTYQKGVFVLGATRGDGKIGEDVTQNLKTIESIPLRLEENIDVVVEGEIYMKRSVFQKLNKERKKRGEEPFANPRNAAAGGVRQLDPKITAERHLDCFVYDYSWPEEDIPKTQFEELHRLMELGFKVNKKFKLCQNISEIIEFWKEWQKKREEEDYWIDGIVVKVNRRDYQEKLGYTGKAPRWAVAFKWPGEQATTILEDVVFQVGRTGKITPVAVLRPVNVRGTTVTRATLHNADEIKRLGIKIKDTVIVEKAGDVIPHIVKVLPNLRPKDAREIQFPEKCPICGSKVIRPKGEVAHYCSNKKCGAKQKNHLYYFASKKAFDIQGLGPKIINQLMDEGLISQPSDLFLLEEGDLEPLERFGAKSASNLVSAIQKSKEITLPRLLTACSIKYVGEETAQLLAEKLLDTERNRSIKTISDLIKEFQSFSVEDLQKTEGIGPKVTEGIVNWFSNEKNIEFLKNLEKVGIKIKNQKPEIKNKKLERKSFVFTGELESMSRDKAKEKVRELGGKTPSNISKKTDFLVVGKNPGSKYEKAKELGVKTISEKEFLKMIKN